MTEAMQAVVRILDSDGLGWREAVALLGLTALVGIIDLARPGGLEADAGNSLSALIGGAGKNKTINNLMGMLGKNPEAMSAVASILGSMKEKKNDGPKDGKPENDYRTAK